jgi:hypothetical protein
MLISLFPRITLPTTTLTPPPSVSFPIYYSNIVTLFQPTIHVRNQKFSQGGRADPQTVGLYNVFFILQNCVIKNHVLNLTVRQLLFATAFVYIRM